MNQQKVHKLDMRRLLPFSLLDGTRIFREMPVGEIMEVVCEDSDDADKFFRLLQHSTFKRMETRIDGKRGIVRIRIVKTANPEKQSATCHGNCLE